MAGQPPRETRRLTPPGGGHKLLRGYLDDLRAATDADEAVLWIAAMGAPDLEPVAWSTIGSNDPVLSLEPQRRALVQWSANERLSQTEGDGRPRFAVAPLSGPFDLVGAISVASKSGFSLPKAGMIDTLERHGEHLAGLHELLVTRDQYARSSQQTSAVLAAAQRFTMQRTLPAVSESIALAVHEMTSGRSLALVRWDADTRSGTVVFATGEPRAAVDTPVSAESQTGEVCAEDMPLIVEDARPLERYKPIYSSGETVRELGSLAILPLHATTKNVIGAIVVEGENPRDIRSDDARNLKLLALLAGASLETVWQIEEITRRATLDPLTGLNNRGAFETLLRHVLSETDRFGGVSSLILLDIDHFKQVNDTYGHPAGDAVLKAVAEVLTQRVRAVDSCARYGGEEMALILPRTELDGAVELAERLREAVAARETSWQDRRIKVTVSCGVATYPSCARNAKDLISAADSALYAAKQAGRDRVQAARVLPDRART